MLKNFFARRKVRRVFGKVVTQETLDDLMDNRPLDEPQIKSGCFEFVFVFIRQKTLEQLSKCMEEVVDASAEQGAMVQTIVGQMVILTFGTKASIKHSPESRSNLIQALRERFRRDIKIVHGAVDGHFGLFGGQSRIVYTFTFPQFNEALARLSTMEFGETEELRA